MQDPQENNFIVGNMNFGSTGANNDYPSGTNGYLENLVSNPPYTGFQGISDGQQQPRDGKADMK